MQAEIRAVVLAATMLMAADSAAAQSAESRATRLASDLAGPRSATQVLAQWCAERGMASPPVIYARREFGITKVADSETRRRLQARSGETIAYRRVRLMCGDRVLSQADNWYLPGRLTTDMNHRLDATDEPFGSVVSAMLFHRNTLEVTPLAGAEGVLRVRAVLISGAGSPFSLVVETYSRDLVTP